ncbi:ribose-5-phosphate isomerase A, partial [Jeotgalibaca porci]
DDSKMVDKLGAFPLPLEVIKYGSQQVFNHLEEKGYKPAFRMDEAGGKYLTDEDNYIIDLHLGTIENPTALEAELNQMVGVVEHGLFLNMVTRVLVGSADGVQDIAIGRQYYSEGK